MRSYLRFAALVCVPALVSLTLLSGCGGGGAEDEGPKDKRAARKPKGGKTVEEPLANPTDGTIKGRVVLDGTAPKSEFIAAMAKHADEKTCLAGSDEEKNTQAWILASDKKGVANVVIKLLPPAGKKFKAIDSTPKEVVMDQPHCAFVPHVTALRPGQVLLMKNSAPVAHNTKTSVDPAAGNENKSVTIQPGKSATFEFNPQDGPVTVACDFHNWMTGLVFVNDNPYIAVTDKDGNFEIPNVPTGIPLKIVGIHEGGTVEVPAETTFKAGANEMNLKVKPR